MWAFKLTNLCLILYCWLLIFTHVRLRVDGRSLSVHSPCSSNLWPPWDGDTAPLARNYVYDFSNMTTMPFPHFVPGMEGVCRSQYLISPFWPLATPTPLLFMTTSYNREIIVVSYINSIINDGSIRSKKTYLIWRLCYCKFAFDSAYLLHYEEDTEATWRNYDVL